MCVCVAIITFTLWVDTADQIRYFYYVNCIVALATCRPQIHRFFGSFVLAAVEGLPVNHSKLSNQTDDRRKIHERC